MPELQSHRLVPHENKRFYRVYDEASQSRFVHGVGFEASKLDSSEAYEYRITPHTLSKHLDWFDPEPSSYISLYDDPWAALKEAWRRVRERPIVFDQKAGRMRHRGIVWIAVINARQMDKKSVFYFSKEELFSMVDVAPDDVIRQRFGRKEWMAMDCIPASAVVGIFNPLDENRQWFYEYY